MKGMNSLYVFLIFCSVVFKSEKMTHRLVQKLITTILNCYKLTSHILLVALVYLDRFLLRSCPVNDPSCGDQCLNFQLTEETCKMAMVTALMLAAKFNTDNLEKKTMFNVVAGADRKQLRTCFDSFLRVLDYDLVVREEDFLTYQTALFNLIRRKYQQTGF